MFFDDDDDDELLCCVRTTVKNVHVIGSCSVETR